MTQAATSVMQHPEPVAERRRRPSRFRKFLVRLFWQVLVLAVVVAIWQIMADAKVLSPLAASKPTDIWHELTTLATTGGLWSNVSVTLEETVYGYIVGSVVGVLAGFGLAFVPKVREVLNPYVTVLNSVPRLALGPLFILWFGIGLMSKVVLVFSLVVFIVFTNTIAGASSIDPDIVMVSRLLGTSRRQLVTKVMIPSTFPWVVAGMRLSIAYAVAGAVVGEMFASQKGIGTLIVAGSGVFNTAEIFAALIVIAVIAAILDLLGRIIERRILRWRPEVELA